MDINPLFVGDPDVDTGDLGDLRLRQDSPAIDAGDDSAAAALTLDLDGLTRFVDTAGIAHDGAEYHRSRPL